MTRVWLVNLFYGPGPAPTGVLLGSLADELLRHGWRVEVLTGTAEYRSESVTAPRSVIADAGGLRDVASPEARVHRFRCATAGAGLRSKFRTWLTFYLKVAWFIIWRRLPDIVIVQTTPPFLHTLFAVRALFSWRRPKIILWNQDTYPESLVATGMLRESSLIYRLLKRIARWSASRIALAVVLDGAMAERLRTQGVRQIALIPNWDGPRQYNDNAAVELPAELRQLAAGYRYRIAYTGNLGRGHDLTPVWNYLRQRPTQTDFCFLFVGEGDRTEELRRMVEREGWSCVKFWSYLPAAEFSALLKWAEFGLVALEPGCLGLMSPSKLHAWLAAGKPVIYIGPEGSNVTETLRAFECGFIVDPSQPNGFDPVTARLLDEDVLELMRRQALIAWETRHSPGVGLRLWWEFLCSQS